jgi:hypothetical protein
MIERVEIMDSRLKLLRAMAIVHERPKLFNETTGANLIATLLHIVIPPDTDSILYIKIFVKRFLKN